VTLRHEVSFFAKLMMNPNCCMMLRPIQHQHLAGKRRIDYFRRDDVVGAMFAVVENNQFYVFQPDVGAELGETNFRKCNVLMMLMYA